MTDSSSSRADVKAGTDCSICFEPFDDIEKKRIPYIIQCGHTFCQGCVDRISECSFCRNPPITMKVVNYALKERIEIEKENKSTKHPEGTQENNRSPVKKEKDGNLRSTKNQRKKKNRKMKQKMILLDSSSSLSESSPSPQHIDSSSCSHAAAAAAVHASTSASVVPVLSQSPYSHTAVYFLILPYPHPPDTLLFQLLQSNTNEHALALMQNKDYRQESFRLHISTIEYLQYLHQCNASAARHAILLIPLYSKTKNPPPLPYPRHSMMNNKSRTTLLPIIEENEETAVLKWAEKADQFMNVKATISRDRTNVLVCHSCKKNHRQFHQSKNAASSHSVSSLSMVNPVIDCNNERTCGWIQNCKQCQITWLCQTCASSTNRRIAHPISSCSIISEEWIKVQKAVFETKTICPHCLKRHEDGVVVCTQ